MKTFLCCHFQGHAHFSLLSSLSAEFSLAKSSRELFWLLADTVAHESILFVAFGLELGKFFGVEFSVSKLAFDCCVFAFCCFAIFIPVPNQLKL